MAFTPAASITYTGVNIVFGAAAAIDGTPGSDRRFMWVKNASGVSTNVTIAIPGTTFGQNNPDVVVAIPAGEERMIGPLPADIETPGTGVFIGVSPTTSVTGAFVDLPKPPPDLP